MISPAAGPDRPLSRLSTHAAPGSDPGSAGPPTGHGGHRGHRLVMLLCCVPMGTIVVLLVASGTAGPGVLLWALGWMVLMVAMMFLMPDGHGRK